MKNLLEFLLLAAGCLGLAGAGTATTLHHQKIFGPVLAPIIPSKLSEATSLTGYSSVIEDSSMSSTGKIKQLGTLDTEETKLDRRKENLTGAKKQSSNPRAGVSRASSTPEPLLLDASVFEDDLTSICEDCPGLVTSQSKQQNTPATQKNEKKPTIEEEFDSESQQKGPSLQHDLAEPDPLPQKSPHNLFFISTAEQLVNSTPKDELKKERPVVKHDTLDIPLVQHTKDQSTTCQISENGFSFGKEMDFCTPLDMDHKTKDQPINQTLAESTPFPCINIGYLDEELTLQETLSQRVEGNKSRVGETTHSSKAPESKKRKRSPRPKATENNPLLKKSSNTSIDDLLRKNDSLDIELNKTFPSNLIECKFKIEDCKTPRHTSHSKEKPKGKRPSSTTGRSDRPRSSRAQRQGLSTNQKLERNITTIGNGSSEPSRPVESGHYDPPANKQTNEDKALSEQMFGESHNDDPAQEASFLEQNLEMKKSSSKDGLNKHLIATSTVQNTVVAEEPTKRGNIFLDQGFDEYQDLKTEERRDFPPNEILKDKSEFFVAGLENLFDPEPKKTDTKEQDGVENSAYLSKTLDEVLGSLLEKRQALNSEKSASLEGYGESLKVAASYQKPDKEVISQKHASDLGSSTKINGLRPESEKEKFYFGDKLAKRLNAGQLDLIIKQDAEPSVHSDAFGRGSSKTGHPPVPSELTPTLASSTEMNNDPSKRGHPPVSSELAPTLNLSIEMDNDPPRSQDQTALSVLDTLQPIRDQREPQGSNILLEDEPDTTKIEKREQSSKSQPPGKETQEESAKKKSHTDTDSEPTEMVSADQYVILERDSNAADQEQNQATVTLITVPTLHRDDIQDTSVATTDEFVIPAEVIHEERASNFVTVAYTTETGSVVDVVFPSSVSEPTEDTTRANEFRPALHLSNQPRTSLSSYSEDNPIASQPQRTPTAASEPTQSNSSEENSTELR